MSAPTTILDGDSQFDGVNELLPPGTLKPGELAGARNNRCRYGKAEPRLGCIKVPWSNLVTSGASSRPIPYGTVYGRGYFQDSDGVLWAIIAADGKVFKFREGNGSSEIALPSGVSITDTVSFTQTVNGLILFRGLGNETLIMASLDTGFVVATQVSNSITGAVSENPSDGTVDIPQADRGEWINARLYVPTETATEKDLMNISDYFNATRFASVRSQARINQGASDRLLRAVKFGRTDAVVCFKTGSIYALYDCNGALSQMQQDEITREFGLLSPRAAINVGKGESDAPDEVWFLGTSGSIYRITPDSGTGLLGVSQVPVSDSIAKTAARINREVAADTATFELWDDKLYCAVPLDDGQALSPELVRSINYSGITYEFGTVVGQDYFWDPGAHDVSLTNGSEVYTEAAQFTATGISVTLTGSENASVTASLKRVFKRVNNAVLVFDFLKGKWAGYDDGTAYTVQEWLKLKVGGEEKLFFIGADGFVNYAEAIFDDEVAYESIGPNLHNTGVYDTFGFSESNGLIVGRLYAYVTGPNEILVQNGTLTFPTPMNGSGTFVATSTILTSYGPALSAIGFAYRLIDWVLEYAAVEHEWLSRAYRCQSLDRKRFPWVHLNVRTFNPSFNLEAITDGANEEFDVATSQTRDNTAYLKPAGTAPWDETNVNGDHANPYREDYHVDLSDAVSNGGDIVEGLRYYVDSADAFTAASITYDLVVYNRGQTFVGVVGQTAWTVDTGTPVVYPPGSYLLLGDDGVVMDLHQEAEENFRVGQRGREIQFRGTNEQGRCELVSLLVEGFAVDQRKQTVEA
jgi:hypothetical protein